MDSFKGCLSASEASNAAALGLERNDEAVIMPLSDGGDGFVRLLSAALRARICKTRVHDPLGRETDAEYGLTDDGIGIVDTASASGLTLLSPEERNPLITSSFGTGELIMAAVRAGARTIYLGLGGSATNDGGTGMLDALGINWNGDGSASRLPLTEVSFHCFCDVTAPFTGQSGATMVFAPQKGASEGDLEILEKRMKGLETVFNRHSIIPLSDIRGSGAAGGIGGAAAVFLHARMHIGSEAFLDCIGMDKALRGTYAVITGEGRSDSQTLLGKAPSGVLEYVRKHSPDTEVWLISGAVKGRDSLLNAGFRFVETSTPVGTPLQEAVDKDFASAAITRTVRRLRLSLE